MTLLGLHIGPPWWPIYLGITLALAVLNRRRSDLLLIALGLIIVQLWKMIPIGEMIWICFSATWVGIAGLMVAKPDAVLRQSVATCALTLVSAMCYPAGRMIGAEFSAGDPMWMSPLFWADMALIAAIFNAGGRGLVSISANIARRVADVGKLRMGRSFHRCQHDNIGSHCAASQEETQ